MACEPVIELAGVDKRYGRREVLRDLTVTVARGECVALLGHNGAGKTTLMKLLLGLTRPSGGRIRIGGEDPTRLLRHGLHVGIGFLPENVAFNDALTGLELLRFYARLKRVPTARCTAQLERVGLVDAAHRRVATYSKGMRQRLGLAQALLGAPRILLLDEPTTGLDPRLREIFYDLVRQHADTGGSALLSSHALTEIEARSERVAILKEGRLVAFGTLAELRRQARLPVRIRVTTGHDRANAVAERLGSGIRLAHVNNETLDLACLGIDKLELVSRLAELRPEVVDVDIRPPGLDEVYAHFTGAGAPQ